MNLNDYSKECADANLKWDLDLTKPCPVCVGITLEDFKCLHCNGLKYTIKTPNFGEKIALIHSELSEALEGHRKDRMDDHLPHRRMDEVELADTLIRIFHLAGFLGMDLEGAYQEKMAYNAKRADHKIENRLKADGKKY